MRFDEFLDLHGISLTAVDRYDGYIVQVAVPADWEAVDTSWSTTPVWIWREGCDTEPWRANAVLTLARADRALEPAEVFVMLCEWQVQMLTGVHEVDRDPAVAHEGPGVMGTLDLLINTDAGILESVVMSRIIATDSDTLIAQLTLTAPLESAMQRSRIGFGLISSSPPAGPYQFPDEPAAAPGAPATISAEV